MDDIVGQMPMTTEHVLTRPLCNERRLVAAQCKTRLQTAVHQNRILNAGPSKNPSNSSNHPHKNNHGARNNHQLIEVIIEEKSSLFVRHRMRSLGRREPHLRAGRRGWAHGDIPSSILIPAYVDAVKGPKSPFTGKPVYVIGAGTVYDGRGLAANLMWAAEAGCAHPIRVGSALPPSRRTRRKSASCSAGFEDAVTTLIFTGRTLYIEDRNLNRQAEIEVLTGNGKLPHEVELEKRPEISLENRPWLMGRVSALINDMLPAQVIVDNMVRDAARGDSRIYVVCNFEKFRGIFWLLATIFEFKEIATTKTTIFFRKSLKGRDSNDVADSYSFVAFWLRYIDKNARSWTVLTGLGLAHRRFDPVGTGLGYHFYQPKSPEYARKDPCCALYSEHSGE
ncbi:hypothetical protein B0H13DRAFT_2292329 [Mycena leptocephala]|nr:hypothetical protein B0H13DRAFT_2292329 [Mycena leptocephala]